jgi:ribonucleotide monophosphatase NagD (HAD superfamily)
MIYEVMKKFGVKAEDTVVCGDRLYTDIASGNNAGVDTVCVLSGEVTLEEVNEAQGVEKPTFLLNHVKELLL